MAVERPYNHGAPPASRASTMASWQLLLSPRPERRTNVASAPHMAGETGAIRYDFPGRDPVTGRIKIRETHYWAHEKVRRGKSGPPL
jgi:hypothetical protein